MNNEVNAYLPVPDVREIGWDDLKREERHRIVDQDLLWAFRK